MENIQKQIELARKNLLDLTMRNRLLNFRPSTRRTLRIIEEIPREIYELLVINEKAMEFLPKPKEESKKDVFLGSPFAAPKENLSDVLGYEESNIWKLPSSGGIVADKHSDRYLQTNLEPESLQRNLFYIYQESNSILEEQGYTILYLALGLLEWRESTSSNEPRQAPLLLSRLNYFVITSSHPLKSNGPVRR